MEENNKKELNEELKNIETCQLVDKHFSEAAKYRKQFESDWEECEQFYDGKHWKDKSRTYKNILFPLIEQEVSQLTDSMPGTDVLAYREEQEEAAKTLESAIHFVYEQQNLQIKQVMAIRSMLKTGTAFHYVDFDPEADQGEGQVTIKNIPWRHVYLDPVASELDEASFVGIKFPIRVSELKKRFPKFKDKIKADGAEDDSSSFFGRGNKENKDSLGRNFQGQEDRYQIDGMTTLEEAWLRDYTLVDIPEEETAKEIEKETEEFFNGINPSIGRFEDHVKHIESHLAQIPAIAAQFLQTDPAMVTPKDIEMLKANDEQFAMLCLLIEDHNKIHEQYYELNPEGKKPKYNSSLRLVMKTGKTILYDDSAPVDDGMVPLVPYYAYKEEDSIWAFGEVKNLLSSQKSYNEMDHAEYTALKLSANSHWTIDANCGVKPSQITNKEGVVYVVNPGARFEKAPPGQVSPQFQNRKQADASAMYDISGVNEASQGKTSGSITAARAIEALQATSAGRIRLKSTQLALYSTPRLGRLVGSRICKYYTTEKAMRLTDSSTGETKSVVFNPEVVKDLEWMIRAVPGTLAGTDKAAIYNAMATFADKQMITPKMFFQIVDVPNKKKILEEIELNDQMTAQMQMLAQENEQLKQLINGVPAQEEIPAQTAPQTV